MLHIARTIVFGLSIATAASLLGLSAQAIYYGSNSGLVDLTMVASVLTVVSLSVMLIFDVVRNGAFTSTISFELAALFILWVSWLAIAVYTGTGFLTHSFEACLMALSYSTWLLLMLYFLTLLVMSIRRTNRGESTWKISVKHCHFFDPRSRLVRSEPAPFDITTMQQLQWPSNVVAKPLPPIPSTHDRPTRETSPTVPRSNVLYIARIIVFSLAIVFAIILLALSSWQDAYADYPPALVGLAIATCTFTLSSLPAMLIIDVICTGVFTSMIAVELFILSVLCVFWLVTSAIGTQSAIYENWQSVWLVFACLSWILLVVYIIAVLIMAIKRARRGERTWTISVKNARFFDPRSGTAKSNHVPFDIATMQQLRLHANLAQKSVLPTTSTQNLPTREPSVAGDNAV